MIKLRPYQPLFKTEARVAFRAGKKSILCVSPTGSGKTVIFADITANAVANKKRVLILTHRSEIAGQIIEKLNIFGIHPGQIMSGRMMTRNPVQVAMIGTIVNRLDKIGWFDLIIIDEGHHAVAASWLKVLNHFRGVPRMLFTATPERLDGQGLGDICDHMIQGWGVMRLIMEGYLVMPMVKKPPGEFNPKFNTTMGDFDKKQQARYYSTKKIVGDVIEHHREYLKNMPTLSFVCSLEHGQFMEGVYRDAGIKAKLIQGGNKYMAERKRACKEFADGSLEILISCNVISEGFDVPVACGCHMLRLTKSLALNDQWIGRTLRPYYASGYCLDTKQGRLAAIKNSVKPVSYVLDFAGNAFFHPHITLERNWDLNGVKRKAVRQDPNITHCPRCGGVWPGKPRVCPDSTCKYNFVTASLHRKKLVIEEVAGQLVDSIPGADQNDIIRIAEILATGTPAEKQRAMMAEAYKAVATDNREKLQALCEAAGYKPGWMYYAWKHAEERVKKNA